MLRCLEKDPEAPYADEASALGARGAPEPRSAPRASAGLLLPQSPSPSYCGGVVVLFGYGATPPRLSLSRPRPYPTPRATAAPPPAPPSPGDLPAYVDRIPTSPRRPRCMPLPRSPCRPTLLGRASAPLTRPLHHATLPAGTDPRHTHNPRPRRSLSSSVYESNEPAALSRRRGCRPAPRARSGAAAPSDAIAATARAPRAEGRRGARQESLCDGPQIRFARADAIPPPTRARPASSALRGAQVGWEALSPAPEPLNHILRQGPPRPASKAFPRAARNARGARTI